MRELQKSKKCHGATGGSMRVRAILTGLTLFSGAAAPLPAQASKPDTPEAVVERYVSAMRKRDWNGMAALMDPQALAKFRGLMAMAAKSDKAAPLRDQLFGGATANQLDSLSDREFFARFLAAAMSQDPAVQSMMDSTSVKVIGHVEEAPNLVHVVYTMQLSLGQVRVSKPDVLTLRRTGNTWLALLRADLEVMAAALRQQFGS